MDPLIMRLRALQAAANNQNTQATLSWPAVKNMGIPVGYDEFAARWDSPDEGPMLKQLVTKFDGAGLTVKTKEKELPQGSHKETELRKMAKRATHKNRKFD